MHLSKSSVLYFGQLAHFTMARDTLTTPLKPQLPHKRTPTAALKESLRKSCLKRARNRRNKQDARCIVRDELEQHGMSVDSPCSEASEYRISEQEWIELLEMVEQEYEQAQLQQWTETEEQHAAQEEYEQRYLLEQANDFDEWQAQQLHEEESFVLCPICQDANLLQTDEGILCPNHMDGYCSLQLSRPLLQLETLRELLRLTFDRHGSHCSGKLSFQVAASPADTTLVAVCSTCREHTDVLASL
jgi:hypothetical protein